MYLHLLLPPDPSNHTYRRVQYVTQQQQSKYPPTYSSRQGLHKFHSVKCTFSPCLALHYQLLVLMLMWGGYSDATPWRLNMSGLEKESGQPSRYSSLFQAFLSTQHLPLQEVLTSPTSLPWQGPSLYMELWFATLSPTSAQLLFLGEGARSKSHWLWGHLVKSCFHTKNVLSVY